MTRIHRRTFVQGATATAATLALAPLVEALRARPAAAATGPASAAGVTAGDEAALIALSRDAEGGVHVDQAAFVTGRAVIGSLPLTPQEVAALRRATRTGDFAAMQSGGLWAGGRRFVFIGEREGGQGLRGARPGAFVTVQVDGDRMVVATARAGMAHTRTVEAVHQFIERTRVRA